MEIYFLIKIATITGCLGEEPVNNGDKVSIMCLFVLSVSVGNPVASKAYLHLFSGNQMLLLDELGKVTKSSYSLNTLMHLF